MPSCRIPSQSLAAMSYALTSASGVSRCPTASLRDWNVDAITLRASYGMGGSAFGGTTLSSGLAMDLAMGLERMVRSLNNLEVGARRTALRSSHIACGQRALGRAVCGP